MYDWVSGQWHAWFKREVSVCVFIHTYEKLIYLEIAYYSVHVYLMRQEFILEISESFSWKYFE